MKGYGRACFLLLPFGLAGCAESRSHADRNAVPPGSAGTSQAGTGGGTSGSAGSDRSEASGGRPNGGRGGGENGGGSDAGVGAASNLGGAGAGETSVNGGANNGGSAGAATIPPLEVHPPATPAACSTTQCRVVGDWDALETNYHSFDDFRVAASSDTSYLTLMSYDGSYRRRLVAFGADGALTLDQGLVPIMDTPLLAVDSDGAPHVAGFVMNADHSQAYFAEATLTRAGWAESSLAGVLAALDFQSVPRAAPAIFMEDDAMAFSLAAQDAGGAWQHIALPAARSLGFSAITYPNLDVSLDAQGKPALFYGTGSAYGAVDANGNTLFEEPATAPLGHTVTVRAAASLAQPLAAGQSEFAVAALSPDVMRVTLAGRSSAPATLTIDAAALPPYDCPTTATQVSGTAQGDECAPACPWHGAGLVPEFRNGTDSRAFALARTADGAAWLAYVHEDVDGEMKYTLHCTATDTPCFSGGFTCSTDGPTGTPTWELRVARIAADGSSSSEVLRTPLPTYVQPSNTDAWGVRARAFGRRVVIGVSVDESPPARRGVRLVTLEAPE